MGKAWEWEPRELQFIDIGSPKDLVKNLKVEICDLKKRIITLEKDKITMSKDNVNTVHNVHSQNVHNIQGQISKNYQDNISNANLDISSVIVKEVVRPMEEREDIKSQ